MAARDIKLMNAVYPDVPRVVLPVDGGGTATFTEITDTTATAADVLSPKTIYTATNAKVTGTIPTKTGSDLTASGATVSVPAGYYASDTSKAVASGSASTPATSISVTPGFNIENSTGIVTSYVSAGKNIAPSVTEGYVTSGTSGLVSVSGSSTYQLSTKAAQTYHPSTEDQYTGLFKFLTGEQTIKGVTLTNLTAGNIKSGVTVKVGDSTDDDCVTSVTGTYVGGESNDFIVTLSYNQSTEKWEPDKTYSEITTAYNGGLNIAVKTNATSDYSDMTADGLVQDFDGYLYFNYAVRYIIDDDPWTIREELYTLYQSTITLNDTNDYVSGGGGVDGDDLPYGGAFVGSAIVGSAYAM